MTPLSIAICDDAELDREILEALIQSFCNSRNLPATIDLFSCGEVFLTAERIHKYDIIFMDIILDGMDGIETIQNLRNSTSAQVVFTTCSREHAVEAFGLNAAHYLLKPLTEDTVREAMNRCLARLNLNDSACLDIKAGNVNVHVPICNIIYIEVINKICIIHTEKNSWQTYASLRSISENLDSSTFMRAQRGFIVNMNYIESFFFDHIVLINGIEIILSRKNRTELKNQYQHFLFRLAKKGEL